MKPAGRDRIRNMPRNGQPTPGCESVPADPLATSERRGALFYWWRTREWQLNVRYCRERGAYLRIAYRASLARW
jgi:hypothetical protein